MFAGFCITLHAIRTGPRHAANGRHVQTVPGRICAVTVLPTASALRRSPSGCANGCQQHKQQQERSATDPQLCDFDGHHCCAASCAIVISRQTLPCFVRVLTEQVGLSAVDARVFHHADHPIPCRHVACQTVMAIKEGLCCPCAAPNNQTALHG